MTTRLAGHANNAYNRAQTQQWEQAYDELKGEMQHMEENYHDAAAALLSLRAEDEGWLPLNRLNQEDGFELDALKEIAQKAELQATGNPLLKRGFTIRRDNVFGRGVTFQQKEGTGNKISTRIQAILDENAPVLMAFEKNERSAFTAGNLIMAYNITEEEFYPINFQEISNFAANPNLADDVWYYEHTYTPLDEATNKPAGEPVTVWYPVLERWEKRAKKPLRVTIAGNKVDDNIIIIDFKVNTVNGHVWGVPDCLPAMPYAWAHAEYIRDASKLLKALATIAWKVVARSKANAVNAAAKSALPKAAGSTASMTAGTDLVSMPRSGQVDMKDGQTIAAYVASALEVSLVALLSDPSAASGSYGAAATLDGPSANAARARQNLWVEFYKRVYRVLGVKDVIVNFPVINTDPIYRTVQTLQIGFAYGAISQSEFRDAFIEATDVIKKDETLPEPSPFTTAAKYSLEAQAMEEEAAQREADAAIAAANVQGQGVSNGTGAGSGSNDLRDAGRTPGTSS